MDQKRWKAIEEIYNAAFELEGGERTSFLDEVCGEDEALRKEVESLLAEADIDTLDVNRPLLSLGLSVLAGKQSEALIGTSLGRYKIVEQIGRGGMGDVYLAQDLRLERRVAVKVLPSHITEQKTITRFRHEARAASAISHPGVAHIYELGEANGRLFIAMEFVDGDTLRKRMSDQALTLGDAIDIASQTAVAMDAAHAEGIVHRDIKPENIIIRRDGLVKVIDFGLAKLADTHRHGVDRDSNRSLSMQTEPGLLMGTANYMSPEQARGQEIDKRTDIWSWGVVFYEMLAGETPFSGATNSDVIAGILTGDPRIDRSRFPDSICQILERSLCRDQELRCSDASEIVAGLSGLRAELGSSGLLRQTIPLLPGKLSRNPTPGNGSSRVTPQAEWTVETVEQPKQATDDAASPDLTLSKGRTVPRPMVKFAIAGSLLTVVAALIIYGFVSRNSTPGIASDSMPKITDLTKDGRVMDVAISGDGGRLAYSLIESGKQALWIRSLENGEEQQLLPPDASRYWGMRFTPDGQSLLYIATQPNSPTSVLYKISVRGGQPRKLAVNIAGPPAISPDGMQIAFVRPNLTTRLDKLMMANIDGSAERDLASRQKPDGFSYSSPSWSPDGKSIAVGAERDDTKASIMAIRVDGGPHVELTSWLWADIGGMAWDNDGRTLIFSARPSGSRVLQLWKLSYPDGELINITDGQNAYEEVTLASNAKMLVTTHTYEVSDVWAIGPSGPPRRLTSSGSEGADGLTVTGTGRIVYTNGEYEQSILWSMNMEGGDRKRLAENTGFLPSASADGRFIAYVSTQQGVRHIWIMDSDGKNNRPLTIGGGENFPSMTPDGNWVVYASVSQDHGSLWKIPTGGGEAVRLTTDAIMVKPVVSPDGTKIACAYRQDESDIWKIAVLPITGGQPLKTFALPNPRGQMLRWTPDSLALLYLDKSDGAQNVWRQPLDGSTPTRITGFVEDLILHHDRSSNGTEYVLARGGRRRDIAIMKNYK